MYRASPDLLVAGLAFNKAFSARDTRGVDKRPIGLAPKSSSSSFLIPVSSQIGIERRSSACTHKPKLNWLSEHACPRYMLLRQGRCSSSLI